MSRVATTGCVLLLLLGGCPDKPAASGGGGTLADPNRLTGDDAPKKTLDVAPHAQLGSEVVATVDGRPITYEQLQRPVIEAYGLPFLLHLVRVEVYRQKAAEQGLSITPADVAAQRDVAMEGFFKNLPHWDQYKGATDDEKRAARKKDMEGLLPQVLERERVSEQEFDLAMTANAYLAKLADRQVAAAIDDKVLQDVFKIKYGEKVRVRHIQFANRRDAQAALARIQAGQPFEQVAREKSVDPRTKDKGGELRPFSRAEPNWPAAFKEAAFALQPGEMSDVIDTGDSWHVVKVEERIPPSAAVKFEDHKDVLREEVHQFMVAARVKQLREAFDAEARAKIKIQDPVLRRKFVELTERAAGANAAGMDPARLKDRMVNDARAATRPTTQPDGRGEVARPPATRPGGN